MNIKLLEAAVDTLNKLLGAPLSPYAEDGTPNYQTYSVAKVGNKYQLQRIVNKGGGIQLELSPFPVPAQTLYDLIHAYIKGIEQGQKATGTPRLERRCSSRTIKEAVDFHGITLVLMNILFLLDEGDNFNTVVKGFEDDGAMSGIIEKLYNEIC